MSECVYEPLHMNEEGFIDAFPCTFELTGPYQKDEQEPLSDLKKPRSLTEKLPFFYPCR